MSKYIDPISEKEFKKTIDDFNDPNAPIAQNQSEFRKKTIKKFPRCCLTNSTYSLDIAHILPKKDCILQGKPEFELNNAIPLRKDIHKLFDKYELSINPQTGMFEFHPNISEIISNLRDYNECIDMETLNTEYIEIHYNKFIENVCGELKTAAKKIIKTEKVDMDSFIIMMSNKLTI